MERARSAPAESKDSSFERSRRPDIKGGDDFDAPGAKSEAKYEAK